MVGGLVVVPGMYPDWLHILVREINYSHYFGVERYGCVNYLWIRLESGRNAKNLKKFFGFNAVIKENV